MATIGDKVIVKMGEDVIHGHITDIESIHTQINSREFVPVEFVEVTGVQVSGTFITQDVTLESGEREVVMVVRASEVEVVS